MNKQLTTNEQNRANLATSIIEERGGTVTGIKITDTRACGASWREINLMGTSKRSTQETIQGKVLPNAYQEKHKQEIYTGC